MFEGCSVGVKEQENLTLVRLAGLCQVVEEKPWKLRFLVENVWNMDGKWMEYVWEM